jgi:phosphoglycolate phosphatase-like HAD superfamily hydrolase
MFGSPKIRALIFLAAGTLLGGATAACLRPGAPADVARAADKIPAEALPSWKDGPARKAILDFVRATTEKAGRHYVHPNGRIATFDLDGTLWVEQPMYTQVVFALHRFKELARDHPEWKTTEPFASVLADERKAMAKLSIKDLEKVVSATDTLMRVEAYHALVKSWLAKARHPRFDRPYTDLVYQPMLEVMRLLRANGFQTWIVTGSGQDFVRVFSRQALGVPLEQVVGSALQTRYAYDKEGKGVLLRSAKLLLDDNFSGKPQDIHLFIGRRPLAAFGNSTGDRQMLEWTQAGAGARLMMLVHHDDAKREYAYGAKSRVGTFSDNLMKEAKKRRWVVISMKNDWKRVFAFEK